MIQGKDYDTVLQEISTVSANFWGCGAYGADKILKAIPQKEYTEMESFSFSSFREQRESFKERRELIE